METATKLQVLDSERPEIKYYISSITRDKRKCFVKNVNLLLLSINLLQILLHEAYFYDVDYPYGLLMLMMQKV
jgi:hypothetical protein